MGAVRIWTIAVVAFHLFETFPAEAQEFDVNAAKAGIERDSRNKESLDQQIYENHFNSPYQFKSGVGCVERSSGARVSRDAFGSSAVFESCVDAFKAHLALNPLSSDQVELRWNREVQRLALENIVKRSRETRQGGKQKVGAQPLRLSRALFYNLTVAQAAPKNAEAYLAKRELLRAIVAEKASWAKGASDLGEEQSQSLEDALRGSSSEPVGLAPASRKERPPTEATITEPKSSGSEPSGFTGGK